MAIKYKVDKGIAIATLLWTDIEPIAGGSFWDKYGQDGYLNGKTLQIKYDSRIALSHNLYHEIYEKSALNDKQLWRKSPGIADAYIFTSETNKLIMGWYIPIDILALVEEGRKLIAIYPNNGAKTSLGFLISIDILPKGTFIYKEQLKEVVYERKG